MLKPRKVFKKRLTKLTKRNFQQSIT